MPWSGGSSSDGGLLACSPSSLPLCLLLNRFLFPSSPLSLLHLQLRSGLCVLLHLLFHLSVHHCPTVLLRLSLFPEPTAAAPADLLNQRPALPETDSTLSSPPRSPPDHFLLSNTLSAHDDHIVCTKGSRSSSRISWEELRVKLNLPEDWEPIFENRNRNFRGGGAAGVNLNGRKRSRTKYPDTEAAVKEEVAGE